MSEGSSARMIAFGKRLRDARKALGWKTLRDFARELEELETTASMWERGERYPRVESLINLKRKTGLTLDYLLDGDPAGLPLSLANELRVRSRATVPSQGA